MSEENIDEEVINIVNQIIDEIEYEDIDHICDDCSVIDSTVKRQNRSQRTTDNSNELYLCLNCSQKRHDDAQKVLRDLESLAQEVEQRLQAIENTERELDQWRDQQLQKNRDFWDEYRRQVENFSACRIRTLQYEYTMKQLKTKLIIKRLKRAKYLAENIEQLRDQLNNLLQPSSIDFICSEKLKNQFFMFLSANEQNSTITIDDKKEFFQQIEQLSCLDHIILPDEDFIIDDQIQDEIDQ